MLSEIDIKDYKQLEMFQPDPLQEQVVVKGFEGLYSVSIHGDVISHGGKSNHKNSLVLKPSIDKDGYKKVTLQKNGKRSYFRVCRLVATAFLGDPPTQDSVVNHKDFNKANDCAYNLEWVSPYKNWKHSEKDQVRKEISVIQLDMFNNIVNSFKSLMEAARALHINQGNISNCISGRCKSVGGFKWKML